MKTKVLNEQQFKAVCDVLVESHNMVSVEQVKNQYILSGVEKLEAALLVITFTISLTVVKIPLIFLV